MLVLVRVLMQSRCCVDQVSGVIRFACCFVARACVLLNGWSVFAILSGYGECGTCFVCALFVRLVFGLLAGKICHSNDKGCLWAILVQSCAGSRFPTFP